MFFSDLFDELIIHVMIFLFVDEILKLSLVSKRLHQLCQYELNFCNKSVLMNWKRTHDKLVQQGAFLEKPNDPFFHCHFLSNEGLLIQYLDVLNQNSNRTHHFVKFYSSFGAMLKFELEISSNDFLLHRNYHFLPRSSLLIFHFGQKVCNRIDFVRTTDVLFDLNDLSLITVKYFPKNGDNIDDENGRCAKCKNIVTDPDEIYPSGVIFKYDVYKGPIMLSHHEMVNNIDMLRSAFVSSSLLLIYENGKMVKTVASFPGHFYHVVDKEHILITHKNNGSGQISHIFNIITNVEQQFCPLDYFDFFVSSGPYLLLRKDFKWSLVERGKLGFNITKNFEKQSWMMAFCPLENRFVYFNLIPNKKTQ